MSDERMTWEEKLAACQALAECHLRMRKPGDWYVSHRVEVADGYFLRGSYGEGRSPQEAVESHWKVLTVLQANQSVVTNALTDERKEWRWNGFMWQDWKREAARVG